MQILYVLCISAIYGEYFYNIRDDKGSILSVCSWKFNIVSDNFFLPLQFRVALLLSKQHDEFLTSEQSVIISTLPMGVPLSEPAIVRAVAVDHTRISVTWEPGPFPNGPVLSYVLQIRDLSLNISALKVSHSLRFENEIVKTCSSVAVKSLLHQESFK